MAWQRSGPPSAVWATSRRTRAAAPPSPDVHRGATDRADWWHPARDGPAHTVDMKRVASVSEHPDPLAWLEAERREPGGSRVGFREQLADIDRLLIEAGELVAETVGPITAAFLEADHQAAQAMIARAPRVDRRCSQLEEACYVLLARQSPVGGDLRHVVAVLRSVADVQRSGYLLTHVAESLTWVHPPSMPDELRDTIAGLGAVAEEVFRGGVAAWRDHDALASTELERRDDEADLLQKVLLGTLYTGEQSVEEAVSLALIARYYERVADHGVEMARQVAYFLTGDRPPESGLDDD